MFSDRHLGRSSGSAAASDTENCAFAVPADAQHSAITNATAGDLMQSS